MEGTRIGCNQSRRDVCPRPIRSCESIDQWKWEGKEKKKKKESAKGKSAAPLKLRLNLLLIMDLPPTYYCLTFLNLPHVSPHTSLNSLLIRFGSISLVQGHGVGRKKKK